MKVMVIDIKLSFKEYLYKIKSCLKDIINDLKKIWYVISSKDTDKEHVMHSKSSNRETMINNKADEVTEELFQSLLSR